jgi:hypothetical protein
MMNESYYETIYWLVDYCNKFGGGKYIYKLDFKDGIILQSYCKEITVDQFNEIESSDNRGEAVKIAYEGENNEIT